MIDRVVRIIRTADDDDDSRRKLIAELKCTPHGQSRLVPIDDIQAQHIIDMALKKINALNQLKIDEELRAKAARVDEITAVLTAAGGIDEIVRAELDQARTQFGQPRRTVIPGSDAAEAMTGNAAAAANGQMSSLAAPPAESIWAYVASDGTLLLAPRTGKPVTSAPLRVADSAALTAVAAARSDATLLLFSAQGRAYRVTLSGHPVTRAGAGRPVVTPGRDPIVAAFSGPDAPYYLLVTAGGQIKRVPARTLQPAHAAGIICCRVPDGDKIVAVVPHGEDDDILIAKARGQVLRIQTGTKLRAVPTAAAGTVTGVKVEAGDGVVSAVKAAGTSLLSIHGSGMALAVNLDEYPVQGRGAGGVQSVLADRPARAPAGDLALIVCQAAGTTVTVFSARGTMASTTEADNPILHRATNSRPFLALEPGDVPAGEVGLTASD